MALLEFHLLGKGLSGRGVRVRTLSPSEIDSVVASAMKALDGSASSIEYMRKEQRFGAEAMIVSVTAAPVAALPDPAAKWSKFDADKDAGLFTTKDWEVLRRTYSKNHATNDSEVDAILGKAIEVSED